MWDERGNGGELQGDVDDGDAAEFAGILRGCKRNAEVKTYCARCYHCCVPPLAKKSP